MASRKKKQLAVVQAPQLTQTQLKALALNAYETAEVRCAALAILERNFGVSPK